MILKRRKSKHVSKIQSHIFTLHMRLTQKAKNIDELKGKELNKKVKELQSISSRMKEYQKYLKLVLL
jgi:predicted RNase H-like nuclease (RuvC/YqgF family)